MPLLSSSSLRFWKLHIQTAGKPVGGQPKWLATHQSCWHGSTHPSIIDCFSGGQSNQFKMRNNWTINRFTIITKCRLPLVWTLKLWTSLPYQIRANGHTVMLLLISIHTCKMDNEGAHHLKLGCITTLDLDSVVISFKFKENY